MSNVKIVQTALTAMTKPKLVTFVKNPTSFTKENVFLTVKKNPMIKNLYMKKSLMERKFVSLVKDVEKAIKFSVMMLTENVPNVSNLISYMMENVSANVLHL